MTGVQRRTTDKGEEAETTTEKDEILRGGTHHHLHLATSTHQHTMPNTYMDILSPRYYPNRYLYT